MKRIWIGFGLILLFLSGCAVQPPSPRKIEPRIKVGLLWGIDSTEFSVDGSFRITSYDGTFIARGVRGKRWRAEVKTTVPGRLIYMLVAGSMSSRATAKSAAKKINKMGFKTFIQPVGELLRIGGRIVSDNRSYRIYIKKAFENEEAAKSYRDSIWNRLETFVVRQAIRKPKGKIILTNLDDGQEFESSRPILIKGASVTIYNVPVGTGYHWEHLENRTYPETICFQLDNEGKLTVINILPLEEYLQGVVPSEMPDSFPLEALKAQAVAARSEVLAKFGIVHRTDPFDVCADVHCQVYSGLSRKSPLTDRAVRETRGLVLWEKGKVCNAVYSAVCGGHGEDADKVWGGQPQSYLRGEFDGSGRLRRYGSLTDEKNLKRWIDANPPAYCNTSLGKVPRALEYTKKYFRWEVNYTQEELKQILEKNTGQNIGSILDLIPLERGISGRIILLRVLGTEGEFTIKGELKIRKAFSNNTLWSSCFYVSKKRGRNRIPEEFILKGAGFGHGVGMCQTGAAVMALRGRKFNEILKHYYKGVHIKKLY